MPSRRYIAAILLAAACLLPSGAWARPAAIPVEGQILGLDGRGLAGARVELRPFLSVYEAGVREIEGRGEPEPGARTASDGKGYFLLMAPTAGVWHVVVSASGFVPMRHPIALLEETSLPVLEMASDAGLTVRVLNPDGGPVAGARVRAEPVESTGPWRPAVRGGSTGPDGTLRLPRVAGEILRVWTVAPGFPPTEAEMAPGGAVVRLAPGVARTFQTYERVSGEPRPGALLWHLPSKLLLGRTGSGGEAELATPVKGVFSLTASTRDGRLAPFGSVPLPKSPAVRCRLHLPPTAALAGKVTGGATRQPLAGAMVWPENDPGAFAFADSKGSFQLPWFSGTDLVLRGAARGHLLSDALPFPVGRPAILSLAPAGSAAGTVVEAEGWPVIGAEIRFLETWMTEAARTRTKPTGRFRATGLDAGRDYVLVAAAPGYRPEVLPLPLRSSGGSLWNLRVVLRRGATASGLLVDSTGQALAGVEVEMRLNGIDSAMSLQRFIEGGLYRTVTGPDGRFEIPGLASGVFELVAKRKGFSPWIQSGIGTPEREARVDLGTITLPQGRLLEGRVVDLEGRPLGGVEVWSHDWSASRFANAFSRYLAAGPSAVTGPDGRFSFASEDAFLWLCREGYAPRNVTLGKPADPPLVMERAGAAVRISGRVVDDSGAPVAWASVRVTDLKERESLDGNPCANREAFRPESETDADGRFVLQIAPRDRRVGVSAEAAGFVSGGEQSVTPREDVDGLEFVLRRGAAIAGLVLAPGGMPVAGAEVSATYGPKARTNSAGTYRLEGVEPGRRELRFNHPEHGRAFRRLEAQPGENPLDVILDGRGRVSIRGRVSGSDGAPLEGARVESDCQCGETTFTGPDGSFLLVLDPGFLERKHDVAEVRAAKPGYAPASQPVKMGSGVEGLEFRLEPGLALSGRVLGAEPAELPNVFVDLRSDPHSWPFWMAAVDREGRYRLEDLAPGEWLLSAYGSLSSRTVRVVLEPGTAETTVDLEIPGQFGVRGTVLGPDGQPLEGVSLRFQSLEPDGLLFTAFSGDEGKFTLSLTEGNYAVDATATGLSPRRLPEPLIVDGPVDDLRIRLQPGVVLKGRILGWRAGIPAEKVYAAGDAGNREVPIAPDGTYRIDDVGPGNWHVEASVGGVASSIYPRSSATKIEIPPGAAEVTWDLDLALGDRTLSGHVESGLEPLHAGVRLLRADGTTLVHYAPLDDDGLFRFPGLSAGRYRLLVIDGLHHRTIELEVDLSEDREVVVDLTR